MLGVLATFAVIAGLWLLVLSPPPHDDAERDALWREKERWFR